MKWFIPILFLFTIPLTAQELLLNIKQLSTKEGLSNRFVSCVLEDLHGFGWLGSLPFDLIINQQNLAITSDLIQELRKGKSYLTLNGTRKL